MYYSKLYERQSTKRRTLTVQTFVKVTTHGLYILGKVSVLLFERGKKKFLGRTTEVYIRELGRIIWSRVGSPYIEINCGHPGHLANGWLENIEAGTALGASVIFRCHPDMEMVGNSSSTVCQLDGTWTYPVPKCLGNYTCWCSASSRVNLLDVLVLHFFFSTRHCQLLLIAHSPHCYLNVFTCRWLF